MTQPTPPSAVDEFPGLEDPEAYGVSVNSIAVEDLFALYDRVGFLYPAKRERLAPFMPSILETWRRTMAAPLDLRIHRVLIWREGDSVASTTHWYSGEESTHGQHLVSAHATHGTRHVMLCSQTLSFRTLARSAQNWFRTENRFPNRVFGGAEQALGPTSCRNLDRILVGWPRSAGGRGLGAAEATPSDALSVHLLAERACDPVWAEAEELTPQELGLGRLDDRYREVGLRRYRRVFISGAPSPFGAALAYRGPLGINFSFLENRCELLIDPDCPDQAVADLAVDLLHAAGSAYVDCELPWILVSTDARTAGLLLERGGRLLQRYRRSTWLRSGFTQWYRHVDGIYARVRELETRRASRLGSAERPLRIAGEAMESDS